MFPFARIASVDDETYPFSRAFYRAPNAAPMRGIIIIDNNRVWSASPLLDLQSNQLTSHQDINRQWSLAAAGSTRMD